MEIMVVFASQTGTAQYYAQQCVKALWSRGLNAKLLDIQNLTLEMLQDHNKVVLFVVATSGQGQMTESATTFWRHLLKADLPDDFLARLRYSVLGLGDSSYQHYNYAAKKLHRRLEQLGGVQVVVRQFADEQSAQGIDDGYGAWMKRVYEYFGVGEVCRDGHMYNLTPVEYTLPQSTHQNASILGNDRMTPTVYEKDVRLISFQFDDTISTRPGDIALLYPHSQDEDVLMICQRFNLNPNQTYKLSAIRPDAQFPEYTVTLHDLCKYHLDIYTPLTRTALLTLSRLCLKDELGSAEKLQDMAVFDYDLYLDYIVRPKRTPFEVFQDFPSIASVPVEALFDIFPSIRPRSFSLAKTGGAKGDLCAALVRYKSPFLGKSMADREGLVSRCLSRLKQGDRVRIVVKSGDISSVDLNRFKSFVLIGAGTGIAPLRAILHSLHGEAVDVYYGCRNVNSDCLFREEFEGMLNVQFTALGSRDDPHGRRHLDRLLLGNRERLLPKLLDPAVLFVLSGNINLPKLVKSSVDAIVGKDGFAEHLQRTGRLVIECWP